MTEGRGTLEDPFPKAKRNEKLFRRGVSGCAVPFLFPRERSGQANKLRELIIEDLRL